MSLEIMRFRLLVYSYPYLRRTDFLVVSDRSTVPTRSSLDPRLRSLLALPPGGERDYDRYCACVTNILRMRTRDESEYLT